MIDPETKALVEEAARAVQAARGAVESIAVTLESALDRLTHILAVAEGEADIERSAKAERIFEVMGQAEDG